MAWTTADIPDLTGRTAVVTGANGGLGLETTRVLAAAGAHVRMACRNLDKARAAADELRRRDPDGSLQIVPLDLASLEATAAAAEQIRDRHDRVDLLVNNAGVMGIPERRTPDGFEMQLGVNHLGHFALTADLLPVLLAAPAARVVSVTSIARHMSMPVRAGDPHLERRYGPWRAYAQSKLANLHFGLGLQQRFEDAGVAAASLVAHPGLSHTDLQARSVAGTDGGLSQRFFHGLARRVGMPPERGVLPQLRAATDPSASGGELYAPRFGALGAPVRRPVVPRLGLQAAIDRLWAVSERETGRRLRVAEQAVG